MRFLHTSDWHLGRRFHNVRLIEDQAHVLYQLLDQVRDSSLDAVIIAGDIYDRAVPPPEAVELLDEVLTKLVDEIGVPTIVIAGNHDGAERLGFGSRLLRERGLFIAGTLNQGIEKVTLSDSAGPVHLVPIPFAMPELVRQWAEEAELRGYEAAMKTLVARALKKLPAGERSIAVAHAFVAGGQECESERALSVGGSGQVSASVFEGFDYVALGHLHRPQSVGAKHIRYSGSLLKYSFSELDHKKSISLVEMDKDGQVQIEELELSPLRELRAVQGCLEDVLRAAEQDPNSDDYILAVLEDREPLLGPMAKLRQVYPRVLHIERPHFGAATMPGLQKGDHRKMSTLDLFGTFWKHAKGEELDEARLALLSEVIGSSQEQDS